MVTAIQNKPNFEWYFWTLTAHEDDRSPMATWVNLAQSWDKIIDLVRARIRRGGHEMIYVRVYEAHKDGAVHIHALVGLRQRQDQCSYMFRPDNDWLSKQNRKHLAGWKTDLQTVEDRGSIYVTGYIIKYFTKMDRPLPKHIRRVQTSQGWVNPERDRIPKGWTLQKKFNEAIAAGFWRYNFTLYDVQEKQEITTDDFTPEGNYKRDRTDETTEL